MPAPDPLPAAAPIMSLDPHPAILRKGPPTQRTGGTVPASAKETDRAFVVALARGLDVLNCFQGGDTALTARDIARRCKLSEPILARLTHTLTVLGYLQYDAQAAAYRLGTASITLAGVNLTQHDVRRMAQPWMEALAEFSRADVALAVRDRMNLVCIHVCRSRAAVTMSLDIGSRMPLARSAMGRAYLSAAPMAERNDLLLRLRDADEYTWSRTSAVIDAAAKEYFSAGFCIALEEWQHGVNEIAVAFCPGGRLPGMTIAVCGAASSLSPEFLRNEIGPRLLELVQRMPTPTPTPTPMLIALTGR
jgi:DNA-binding IclR family transcriptional regulator